LTISTTFPANSTATVQRRVGTKWVTVRSAKISGSYRYSASRSGSYRVVVSSKSDKFTSRTYAVK
jgi:hypothetical protein